MKTICLHFEIHQPMLLKRYRFFDIGISHYYYDDYANSSHIANVAERSYIPALTTLLEMINENKGMFKVAISLSGIAADQLEMHSQETIELLKKIADTGCCEFLAEPYSHGLAALKNENVFRDQVTRQMDKMKALFGVTPTVLANTDLLYEDDMGALAANMGFKGMITEGAKRVLGWKSPHYVYHCNMNPKLKLLLRDFRLSDDIALRFSNTEWSEYPLFADQYINKIAQLPDEEQVITLSMDLDALGISQPLSSNILPFMKALPKYAHEKAITFSTPTEVMAKLKSVSQVDVPYPITCNDEERDVSCWLGNVMQREACEKLYDMADRVLMCGDKRIQQDFDYLQSSTCLRDMSTKESGVRISRGMFDSAYDAFANYMNIIGDFSKRVDSLYPVSIENEELNSLLTTIRNQDREINELNNELMKQKEKVEQLSEGKAGTKTAKTKAEKAKAEKPAAAKPKAAAKPRKVAKPEEEKN